MAVDEKTLVRAAQKGEDSAFEELYMRNKEKIAAVVYYYVGNRQDAEDLLQDIFIKAFLSINKYSPRPGAHFSSWLYRIGINISINFLKKKKRKHGFQAGPDPETLDIAAGNPHVSNPEHSALNKEIREDFQSALDYLSPQQRMVFVLKHFQGLKVGEIARSMGCREGSVRKQLFRAVSKLRTKLNYFNAGAN